MQIAILEDDAEISAITKKWLEDADHLVTVCASGVELLSHPSLHTFDVFLLDSLIYQQPKAGSDAFPAIPCCLGEFTD